MRLSQKKIAQNIIWIKPHPNPSPTMGKGLKVPLPTVGERDLGSGVEHAKYYLV
jgi:hypothetical protein